MRVGFGYSRPPVQWMPSNHAAAVERMKPFISLSGTLFLGEVRVLGMPGVDRINVQQNP